jgi:hypothetical protein
VPGHSRPTREQQTGACLRQSRRRTCPSQPRQERARCCRLPARSEPDWSHATQTAFLAFLSPGQRRKGRPRPSAHSLERGRPGNLAPSFPGRQGEFHPSSAVTPAKGGPSVRDRGFGLSPLNLQLATPYFLLSASRAGYPSPVPAWLGSFRKRSQSTKALCGQSGFETSLGGHGTSRVI